jgi:predicted lipid-binding transport protein (Tim44 family)
MTKISPFDFQPALISTMKSALEAATVHIDNSSGKPATPATKAKMASCILINAAEGVTDADKLRFVAIEEGLCPAD